MKTFRPAKNQVSGGINFSAWHRTGKRVTGRERTDSSQEIPHSNGWRESASQLPLCAESACSVGHLGSIPELRRSPGEGNGYPFQYSGLENSMDCIVHGVAKSQTRLSDFHSLTLWNNS